MRRPPYASPAVRRLARELGVDLSRDPRLRPQGPDHQGGRAQAAAEGDGSARGGGGHRGRRPGPRAVAEGQLRALRRDRAPAADPDPEDQRPEPGPQLGDDPARHPQRRGGHHRAGGVPQAHQRRAVRGQGDDGRAAGQGRRGLAEGVPGRELLARRRRPGAQALLQHRLRGRHAERPRRPGDQGRRPEGHHRDRAGPDGALRQGARRQAGRRRHAGRDVHDLVAGRHRRDELHADRQRARGGDPRRDAQAR